MSLVLPLSRHAVVVPCNSSLFVHVDICRDDEMFANKTIEFPARFSGEDVQIITGVGGMIEVKVSWLSNNGSDKVEGWVVGRGSDTTEYQLHNSFSRTLTTRCVDYPFNNSLRYTCFVYMFACTSGKEHTN
jgi:hypothetical protein